MRTRWKRHRLGRRRDEGYRRIESEKTRGSDTTSPLTPAGHRFPSVSFHFRPKATLNRSLSASVCCLEKTTTCKYSGIKGELLKPMYWSSLKLPVLCELEQAKEPCLSESKAVWVLQFNRLTKERQFRGDYLQFVSSAPPSRRCLWGDLFSSAKPRCRLWVITLFSSLCHCFAQENPVLLSFLFNYWRAIELRCTACFC